MGGALSGPDGLSNMPPKRVILIGFMGSGKSAVGRRLARHLGWRFVDMDREITTEAGRSVAAIFRAEGESGFRHREQSVGERLQKVDRLVISSGGGWPCVPGRLEGLAPGALTIWLQVSADEALRRVGRSRTRRPLLEVEDPEATARELLARREKFYGRADWAVETDGRTPTELARELRDRLVGLGAMS